MRALNGPTIDTPRHPLPSGLLHDLRTPLNHIVGYSELMMEKAQEDGDAGLLPHLQKVCAAVHRLAALITENFESSRTPEGPLADPAPPEEDAAPREEDARLLAAGERFAPCDAASLERKRARDRETYLLEQLRENHRRLKALEKSRDDDRSHG